MNQLTIRGFDDRVRRRLEELARREGISLNKAALRLLQKGAGFEEGPVPPNVVGDSLDSLIGSWSEDEEREFLQGIEAMEAIDPSMWS